MDFVQFHLLYARIQGFFLDHSVHFQSKDIRKEKKKSTFSRWNLCNFICCIGLHLRADKYQLP